eukprot:3623656-Pyramimonas_sp.AAC.1
MPSSNGTRRLGQGRRTRSATGGSSSRASTREAGWCSIHRTISRLPAGNTGYTMSSDRIAYSICCWEISS